MSLTQILFTDVAAWLPPRRQTNDEFRGFQGNAGGLSDADLPELTCVARGLYRGGAPTQAGLAWLPGLGVETIIDLRRPSAEQSRERVQAESLGFAYVHIPMWLDALPAPDDLKHVLTLLTEAPYHPVYIHCRRGRDRTGAIIGLWRVMCQGWRFERAHGEMLRLGFDPAHRELVRAVRQQACGASSPWTGCRQTRTPGLQ